MQVGDPFEEKRLIEACLTLLDAGLVVGIQDLGGAGLTCATSETASRGGVGMDVDVSAVPRREEGMEPFEVMTSESQERMLAIVTPDGLDEVLRPVRPVGGDRHRDRQAPRRWPWRSSRGLRILDGFDGSVLADVPASSLHEDAPFYDRPSAEPADRAARLRRPTRAPRPPPTAGRSSSTSFATPAGSGASTTTSSSSTPLRRPAATPPCSG